MKYALIAVLALAGTANAQRLNYGYWHNPAVNTRVNPEVRHRIELPTTTTVTRQGNTTTIRRSSSSSYYPEWKYTEPNPQMVTNPYATDAKKQRTKQFGREASVIVQEALGGDVQNFIQRAKVWITKNLCK